MIKKMLILFLLFSCNSKPDQVKEYYNSGELKILSEKKNGILNGKRVEYYETGEIRSQTHWKDGLQNGKSIYFFQNGEIESVSYYEEGLLNDTSKLFYSNGKLKDLSFWIDGKLHGQRKKFHMNGVLSFEGNYDYDQPYGKIFFYNEDGSLKYFKEYDYEPKINLAVEKDTLYVNDTINLKISFTNNLHDSIAYLIGSFDENYNLVDTIYSSGFTSDSAEYSFVAEDLGNQKIMGIIQDIEIKDGYLIAKSIPFIKNYYVMQRK